VEWRTLHGKVSNGDVRTMIEYPRLVAVMAERELDAAAVAALAAVDAREIVGALHGRPPCPRTRLRVAEALHVPGDELFAPDGAVLSGVLSAVAQRFGYFVTDPATLRTIEEAVR
jgi:hypothetical protein